MQVIPLINETSAKRLKKEEEIKKKSISLPKVKRWMYGFVKQ
jgi:hypothetical protein